MQTVLIITGVVGLILILFYLFSYKKDSGNLDERIEKVQSKTSKDMNRFAAGRETTVSKARSELDTALAGEVRSAYNLEAARDRAEREEQKEIAEFDNTIVVYQEATRQRISVATYDSLKLEEGLAQVRLLEAQGLKDLEWEYLEKEHHLQLAGAMALAIKEQKELEGLTEMFERVVRRRHEIETGNDPPEIKTALVTRLNKNQQIIEQVMDRENRLFQEVDREES